MDVLGDHPAGHAAPAEPDQVPIDVLSHRGEHGSARPFPAGIDLHDAGTYLLAVVLAVIAGLIGLAFAKIVYLAEDLWNRLWRGRSEWARPAVGGIALGLFLLAVPQMYGVGYPVMYKTVAGGYALWLLILLAAAKIVATSLSLGIGGSGGIFAPSLFTGVTSGYAFGDIAGHVFGPAAGQPALYAVVAMGAVFASAARAPLTSLASVVEMTGNFAITLPVMLAIAIAATASRALSYGTIYTTKLLRRGTDIDRAAPWRALQDLKVTDAMRAFGPPLPVPPAASGNGAEAAADGAAPGWAELAGPATERHDLQVLFGAESVMRALRQLGAYGHDGLPVLSADGEQVQGWVTGGSVLRAIARQLGPTRAGPSPRRARTRQRHARRPRWPGTRRRSWRSRPARPPTAPGWTISPGRKGACRYRCSATGSTATPAPASPCARATGSACWCPRPGRPAPRTSARTATGRRDSLSSPE
jgi:CIC family chloride channel protein